MPFGEHNSWDFFPRHLYQREIMDPYVAMDHFFQCKNLVDFRKAIDDFFHSACAGTCTLEQEPVDALFLYELLEKMLELAYILTGQKDNELLYERRPLKQPVAEMDVIDRLGLLKFHYEKRYVHIGSWDYFPRQLTPEELMDPYLVFKSLFELHALPEWRDELKMCLESAISRQSVYESMGDESNVYMTSILVKKLVEAFFVLYTARPAKEEEYAQYKLQEEKQIAAEISEEG